MPIVVDVIPEADYQKWLAAMKAGQPTIIGHGPAPAQAQAESASANSLAAWEATASAQAASAAPAATKSADLPVAELKQKGEKVYNTQCAACHQATGLGLPPNFPSLHGSKVANGPAEAHVQHVLKGKNLMPSFAHLSDEDLDAALTYERLSWGNQGGPVQPAQVTAQRGK